MDISLYQTIPPDARQPIYPATARSVQAIGRAIEDVVQAHVPQADMAIGLQRFSHFYPHEQHYRELAARCQQIWIFGVPDVAPPSIRHITFVPLRLDRAVAHEWFVIVNSDTFGAALVATEIPHPTLAEPSHFQVCLSADLAILDTLALVLAEGFQVPLVRPVQRDHARQQALFAQVTHHLIRQHDLLAEAALRHDHQAAAQRRQLDEQTREIQMLTGLIPRFNPRHDWQQLLIADIQRRLGRLSA